MRKHIFVTGGVVSGLGKGITAASLGRLLKARGYKVASQKMDPYINVDPGTMSPLQHGEVYVTEDGAEADLDLGHYERFIDENLNKFSSLTTGRIYSNVIERERRGDYLGETVQVVPHVINEIKSAFESVGETSDADIVITEIGGTIGDIESEPFLEAIRQYALDIKKENCLFIHVALVPWLESSKEYKTKPVQHSVKQLQSRGILPDIIVLRSDTSVGEEIKEKIAMFCNVDKNCVIENVNTDILYEMPLLLDKQNFSQIVCSKLRMNSPEPKLEAWKQTVDRIKSCTGEVRIAIVGKYVSLHDAYFSVIHALMHGGYANGVNVKIKWVNSEDVTDDTTHEIFNDVQGILIPGGFGERGVDGMICAAKYSRENNMPYLGICLGMQIAVLDFARNVLGLEDAQSGEFDPNNKYKVIDLMPDQHGNIPKGGTMRLGSYPCMLKPGSMLNDIYDLEKINERHRHRYEFNNKYRNEFENAGMNITGTSPDNRLVEAVELGKNDFHVGVQFHPEFKSRPNKPHPLFERFIRSAM